MTSAEYSNFLIDLEHDIFSKYPALGATNAKSVVSKANMEKHSYGEYEVEQYAYELASFVEGCIKEYAENCIRECLAMHNMYKRKNNDSWRID